MSGESGSQDTPSVAVITGGAGGMGFSTATLLGRDHHVVVSDINQQRVDEAVTALQQRQISCEPALCDVTDRASVDALMRQAGAAGRIACVIHTAGLSPQMAAPDVIMRVNALGTIHITEAALTIADEGFALVNVASMAAHMMPNVLIPRRAYKYAFSDPERLLAKAVFRCRFMPRELYRTGMAYAISKHFVIWYTRKNASRFGDRGARIVSVSPGSFDTQMGRLEEKSGSAELLKNAALKRFGRPDEIAEVLAFCASDKAGYLTGVDILCDGGVVASRL